MSIHHNNNNRSQTNKQTNEQHTFAHSRRSAQIDAIVVDAQQLVHHCLIGPLQEKRRDGIVFAIEQ
jgi:hypothetical protein